MSKLLVVCPICGDIILVGNPPFAVTDGDILWAKCECGASIKLDLIVQVVED